MGIGHLLNVGPQGPGITVQSKHKGPFGTPSNEVAGPEVLPNPGRRARKPSNQARGRAQSHLMDVNPRSPRAQAPLCGARTRPGPQC